MDLLKRELQKKRKAAREDFAGKSFVRRSDLEQKRLQKRRDEQPKAGALESAAAAASDPSSDPYAAAGNLNNPTSCSDDSEPSLPWHEVIRRLRVLREPVTLFGEDDAARVDRLKIALKSSVIDDIDDLDMARSGQTNDFLGDMIEMGKRQKFESVGGDGNGSRSEIVEADADKDSKKRMDPAKFDELCKEDKILVFFNALLNEWKHEVDGMSELEKRTANGKTEVARFNQSARYLGPLYELCRKKAHRASLPACARTAGVKRKNPTWAPLILIPSPTSLTRTHPTASAPRLGRAGSRAERAAAPRGRSAGQPRRTRRRSPRPDSRPAAQDASPLPTPPAGCCCCRSPRREELRRRAAGGRAVAPRGLGTGKHIAGRRRSCKLEGELPPQARSSAD